MKALLKMEATVNLILSVCPMAGHNATAIDEAFSSEFRAVCRGWPEQVCLDYLFASPPGFSTNRGGLAWSVNCQAERYASRRIFAIFT